MQSKDTADVNGTSSQASPSEAWWRTRSIVTKRSSGRRCEHERWRGNELNTELGARYSTRWPRSGCPIRTAPGDSATGIREVSDLLRAVQQRRSEPESGVSAGRRTARFLLRGQSTTCAFYLFIRAHRTGLVSSLPASCLHDFVVCSRSHRSPQGSARASSRESRSSRVWRFRV